MQLDALEAQLGDAVELGHRALALERVDAAKPDEGLRIFAHGLGDQVVGDTRTPGGCLGVPGEQHRHHVHLVVLAGQLLQRLPRHLGAEIRLGRLDVALHGHVEPFGRRQVDVKINRLQSETYSFTAPGSAADSRHRRPEPRRRRARERAHRADA